jgi:hypothetical protein
MAANGFPISIPEGPGESWAVRVRAKKSDRTVDNTLMMKWFMSEIDF